MKKVKEGTVVVKEEDIYILIECLKNPKCTEYELADVGLTFLLQKTGDRKILERKIKSYGNQGFHVTLPKEIASNFETVFLVPARRKFDESEETEEIAKFLHEESLREEKEFWKEVDKSLDEQ